MDLLIEIESFKERFNSTGGRKYTYDEAVTRPLDLEKCYKHYLNPDNQQQFYDILNSLPVFDAVDTPSVNIAFVKNLKDQWFLCFAEGWGYWRYIFGVVKPTFLSNIEVNQSKKLHNAQDKTNIFEMRHIKYFENWRESDVLQKNNRITGVFDTENSYQLAKEILDACLNNKQFDVIQNKMNAEKIELGFLTNRDIFDHLFEQNPDNAKDPKYSKILKLIDDAIVVLTNVIDKFCNNIEQSSEIASIILDGGAYYMVISKINKELQS